MTLTAGLSIGWMRWVVAAAMCAGCGGNSDMPPGGRRPTVGATISLVVGFEGPSIGSLQGVHVSEDGQHIAGFYSQGPALSPTLTLMESRDGGDTWTASDASARSVSNTGGGRTPLPDGTFSDDAYVGTIDGAVYMNSSAQGLIFTTAGAAERMGVPNVPASSVAFMVTDDSVLWAVTLRDIFRSVDKGTVWTLYDDTLSLGGLFDSSLQGLEVSKGPGVFLFAGMNGVVVYDIASKTQTMLAHDPTAYFARSPAALVDGVVYQLAFASPSDPTSRLLKRALGATTWEVAWTGTDGESTGRPLFATPDGLYFGSHGFGGALGLHRFHPDSGEVEIVQPTGLPSVAMTSARPVDDAHLLVAAGERAALYDVTGGTWAFLPARASHVAVGRDGDLFAAHQSSDCGGQSTCATRLLRSTDRGTSFTLVWSSSVAGDPPIWDLHCSATSDTLYLTAKRDEHLAGQDFPPYTTQHRAPSFAPSMPPPDWPIRQLVNVTEGGVMVGVTDEPDPTGESFSHTQIHESRDDAATFAFKGYSDAYQAWGTGNTGSGGQIRFTVTGTSATAYSAVVTSASGSTSIHDFVLGDELEAVFLNAPNGHKNIPFFGVAGQTYTLIGGRAHRLVGL